MSNPHVLAFAEHAARAHTWTASNTTGLVCRVSAHDVRRIMVNAGAGHMLRQDSVCHQVGDWTMVRTAAVVYLLVSFFGNLAVEADRRADERFEHDFNELRSGEWRAV